MESVVKDLLTLYGSWRFFTELNKSYPAKKAMVRVRSTVSPTWEGGC